MAMENLANKQLKGVLMNMTNDNKWTTAGREVPPCAAPLSRVRYTLWLVGFLTFTILVGLFPCAAEQSMQLMPEYINSSFASAAVLYSQHCAACHGPTGEGNGRAYTTFDGTARNFRFKSIRYISPTSSGAPSDEDLVRTIRRGLVLRPTYING